MAAMLDMTSFDEALKVHYTDHRIKNMVYKNNPFLAMVPKYESFTGRNLPLPARYGVPQGRSATFGTASSNKYASNYAEFLLTRVSDYALADIRNEVIEASEGDKGAFMSAVVSEVDGALHSCTRSLANALFRDGTGFIGSVGAYTPAATTFTLADPEDVVNFEVGQFICAAASPYSALRDSGDSVQITAIDRDTGVITGASAWSTTITGFTTADRLYVEGDFGSKISGLEAWVPSSAPGATAFFGVDRSTDVSRLGGLRYDGTAETVEEALISAAARCGREGGRPDTIVMNHKNYAELIKSLGAKVEYDLVRSSDLADVSFKAVQVHAPTGTMRVVADHNCQVDVAWMLQLNTWKLYSLGAAPKILRTDGLKFLRNSGSDSVEVRTGYYAQLGCSAPGWNCRVALAA